MAGERGPARIVALDALRGGAALTVVFHHYLRALPDAWIAPSHHLASAGFWLHDTPLRILWGGLPAVVLFFALSGYALGTSLKVEPQSYLAFAVRRVFRLYPAYLAIVVVSGLGCWFLRRDGHALAGAGAWFLAGVWSTPPSWSAAVHYALLDGGEITLDGVVWSLVHELRISLVFPLIFYATRRWPALSVVASAVISAVSAAFVQSDALTTWADTGSFLFLFVAGCALALHGGRATTWLASRPRVALGLGALGVAAFAFPKTMHQLSLAVIGTGAILLLTLVLSSAAAREYLKRQPWAWLGRVSYSLYLVHLPVLAFVAFGARLPIALAAAVSLPISLLLSGPLFRWVEQPAIRAAKALMAVRPVSNRGAERRVA